MSSGYGDYLDGLLEGHESRGYQILYKLWMFAYLTFGLFGIISSFICMKQPHFTYAQFIVSASLAGFLGFSLFLVALVVAVLAVASLAVGNLAALAQRDLKRLQAKVAAVNELEPQMKKKTDDELRAKSLGIDTTRVKVAVFAISSAIAGLAGGVYGHYIVLLSPQMIDFSEMAKIVVMVVIGGFGSFLGPVVGAAPVQVVLTYLQKYGEWNLAVFALVVIVLMRFSMEGIAALLTPWWRKVWGDRG